MWIPKAVTKGTIIAFLLAGSVSGIVGASAYNRLNDVTVETDKLVINPEPTVVYDKNGSVLAEFNKDRKDKTTYDEIPSEVIDAITSIEDRAFFDHVGINPKAIARAGIAYVTNKGAITQGGSTITQQLVKTVYVGNESSFQRKINEAVLATTLEKDISKEEIITAYLSHIDYGYQSFGIKNAVETYFGQTLEEFKKEDEITRITKAAFLAGLPQAPYGLSPYDENGIKRPTFERALQRRNAVLHAMLVEDKITKRQYDEAIKNTDLLVLNKVKREHQDEVVKYPEFVQYVLSETAEKLNLSSIEDARYSGMRIYTSFDPEVYSIVRKQFRNDKNFPEDAKDGTKVQGSAAVVNPKNGEIYALTGSREETKGFLTGINRSYQIKRQPGSTLKPVIAYGPALEYNVLKKNSSLVNYRGYNFGNYVVKNWDRGAPSTVTMSEAIKQSWNVAAVYALQQTGINRARNFAKNLGIDLTDGDIYLPIALGGLELGTSTLEMADSYQAFSNGGYRIEAHAIKRMVNSKGEVAYESPTKLTESYRVMKKKTANDIKEMLRGVVDGGTGSKANVEGQMISGKTGTAEYAASSDGGNSDIWFVGFTKDYVTAVWMGYDNNTSERYLSKANGGSVPAAMFKEIMTPLTKIRPDYAKNYSGQSSEKDEEIQIPKIKALDVESEIDTDTNTVTLNWEPKKGTIYKVFRNGEEIAAIADKKGTYIDSKTESGTEYKYQVVGFEEETQFKNYESKKIKIKTEESIFDKNELEEMDDLEEMEELENIDEEKVDKTENR